MSNQKEYNVKAHFLKGCAFYFFSKVLYLLVSVGATYYEFYVSKTNGDIITQFIPISYDVSAQLSVRCIPKVITIGLLLVYFKLRPKRSKTISINMFHMYRVPFLLILFWINGNFEQFETKELYYGMEICFTLFSFATSYAIFYIVLTRKNEK